jgi:polyisoprenoid-binding protein YceI
VPCPATSIEVGEGASVDVPLDLRFEAANVQPPSDLSASDRDRMLENLRGRDVLDAERYPNIGFRGRYVGTMERGRLAGELYLREVPRRISIDIAITRDAGLLSAQGVWEGALSDLGIKPFRALLGALKLDDWIRLRLDASWRVC